MEPEIERNEGGISDSEYSWSRKIIKLKSFDLIPFAVTIKKSPHTGGLSLFKQYRGTSF